MFGDENELDFFDEPRTLESTRRRRRPSGGSPRGPRRPAPPPPGAVALARLAGLVALAIAVVVALVFWIGSCQGQSRYDEYSSYAASIKPIAQTSAQIGTQFANELTAAQLTLSGLEANLEQWSTTEQAEYDQAQRIVPPGPLQTAHQQVLDTLQLRAIALAGLADTLAQEKAKRPAPSAASVGAELAAQAQLLTASDIVWTQLFRQPATETLSRLGVTGVIIPPSQFVTNPNTVSARTLAILYARLGSGSSTAGIHGSALIGTQAIAAGKTTTLSTTTPVTVSVPQGLVIRVAFEDSGNFPEVQIPVTLSVLVGGQTVYTNTQKVPQVLAHQQTAVSFTGLQLPSSAFGGSAKISVRIGKVPGEVQLSNNVATYPVFFSLAAGG